MYAPISRLKKEYLMKLLIMVQFFPDIKYISNVVEISAQNEVKSPLLSPICLPSTRPLAQSMMPKIILFS